jgi:SEC-C motif-containing protein
MRSRYSAHSLGKRAYLLETWHPDFRPQRLELDSRICWLSLDIIDSELREQRSMVEFEASLLLDGEVSAMRERSTFIFQQGVLRRGRWLYTSGEQLAARVAPWKPGRNQDCPCGSGRKFKRCCGKA